MMENNSFLTKVLGLCAAIAFIAMMPFSMAMADDKSMPEPQALVKGASDRMLQALKDNKADLEEDPSKVYALVEEILMPNFDFEKMSKLALGKNWRKASDGQRQEFTEQFRLLLIRTYSTAMLEFTDEEIKFLPFRDDLAKRKVKVDMEIIQQGGPSIPMTLAMYENNEKEWKVYDVKIDGISLVTNYRSTFAKEIRNEGMDKLIDNLASRNEKVKV